KAYQACLALPLGEQIESVANHARAGDFAERADVWEARRTVSGLEYHRLVLAVLQSIQPLNEAARFLERPGARLGGSGNFIGRKGGGHDGLLARRKLEVHRKGVRSMC